MSSDGNLPSGVDGTQGSMRLLAACGCKLVADGRRLRATPACCCYYPPRVIPSAGVIRLRVSSRAQRGILIVPSEGPLSGP